MNIPLFDFVMTELQSRKGRWPDICHATGADYSWLTKLAQGKIPNPSVHKIQMLADYFRSKKAA